MKTTHPFLAITALVLAYIAVLFVVRAEPSKTVTDLQRLQEIKKITAATLHKKGRMDRSVFTPNGKKWVQMIGLFATTRINFLMGKTKTSTKAIVLLDKINMRLRDRVRHGDLDYFLDHIHWLDLAAGAALESLK